MLKFLEQTWALSLPCTFISQYLEEGQTRPFTPQLVQKMHPLHVSNFHHLAGWTGKTHVHSTDGNAEVQRSPVTCWRPHTLLVTMPGFEGSSSRSKGPCCWNFPLADSRTNFQSLLQLLCFLPSKGSGGNSLGQLEALDFCSARPGI